MTAVLSGGGNRDFGGWLAGGGWKFAAALSSDTGLEPGFVYPSNVLPVNPTAKPSTAPSAGNQRFLIFDCGAIS